MNTLEQELKQIDAGRAAYELGLKHGAVGIIEQIKRLQFDDTSELEQFHIERLLNRLARAAGRPAEKEPGDK